MRVLLTSLNAKYVHTNLALRYLRATIDPEFPDTRIKEFTINQHLAHIAAEIFEAKADVVGFSCYIWNMTETISLLRRLRPVCPGTRFVLGGPEVSFDSLDVLRTHPEVDAIVVGEGEETFLELLRAWRQGSSRDDGLGGVLGVAWRSSEQVFLNPSRPPLELDLLPNPYATEEDFTGRLVYVETTRGCPFSCQYCLSSTTRGVRYLDPERFREQFRQVLRSGATTVKFVDRTFNTEKRHAFAILDIVREEVQNLAEQRNIRVHCEMAGELLDEAWLAYLLTYPPGLLQFEIGVQSTHQTTLEILRRTQHFQDWQGYVQAIQTQCGIPIHLDLIAGLPAEDWEAFRRSFNEVFTLKPDMLQLGFLKVLKGSGLHRDSGKHGLLFSPDPPYTILQTRVLSHAELLQLERMEDVFNQYYNSGKFLYSVRQVLNMKVFETAFDFFSELAAFWKAQGWFSQPVHGKTLFQRLWVFLSGSSSTCLSQLELECLREALKLDFCLWERPVALPGFLQPEAHFLQENFGQPWEALEARGREWRSQLYQDPSWFQKVPEMAELDHRQWVRASAVQFFAFDLLNDGAGPPQGVWYLFLYTINTRVRILKVF